MFRPSHQVLYRISESGQPLYGWQLMKSLEASATPLHSSSADTTVGLIHEDTQLPMDSNLAALLSWPSESGWLQGRWCLSSQIPWCKWNKHPNLLCHICFIVSSLTYFPFFFTHFSFSFPSNWGALKAKPQNPIYFKFVFSKRRLK